MSSLDRLRYAAELRSAIMRSGRPAADRFLLIRILDLEAVREEAVASVAELAEACGVSAKTASRSLARLELADCFVIVRRSRRDVGRNVRPEAFGLDPSEAGEGGLGFASGRRPIQEGMPPDGSGPPPDGGRRGPGVTGSPPSGGLVGIRPGVSVTPRVNAGNSLELDPPPIVPPSTPSLRDDEDRPSGEVDVADFDTARRRTRQAVGLAWLRVRAMHITADEVNERRVSVWIWKESGQDPGAFAALLEDLLEAWAADPYLRSVRKPWAHLQSQLGVLREKLGPRGGADAARLDAELEALEDALVDAVSFGRGYDEEERLRRELEGVRAKLRGVA